MSDLSDNTTIVVGASRGLGRGIATALAEAGAPVVAVSRTAMSFPEPTGGAGAIQPEVADAGAATVAARLLDRYEPETVVLVAGASPHMRPMHRRPRLPAERRRAGEAALTQAEPSGVCS
jgi:3-oxoacyl-[acyl-carrier protein] reductase